MKNSPLATPPAVDSARLAALAKALTVTVGDIHTMTLAAGVEAIEAALAASGKLELPLRFHVTPPPAALEKLAADLGLSRPLAENALRYAAHPSDRFGVTCTPDERRRWDMASRPSPLILSEWVRTMLNAKADELLEAQSAGRSPGTSYAPAVAIPVSDYHFEGMKVTALAEGAGDVHSWASTVLASKRLNKPARPFSYPDQPTRRTVRIFLTRQRLAELEARGRRAGLPLQEYLHAVLVGASRKSRAALDRQAASAPGPDSDPNPPPARTSNVLPFFTGHFQASETANATGGEE
jgi:hypothetical protein